jgi:hypothetical protein
VAENGICARRRRLEFLREKGQILYAEISHERRGFLKSDA